MTQSLNSVDKIYHEIIADALKEGTPKGDRTGTGTKAVVGRMARFDLRNRRVPRLTTKPVISMNPEEEMFWFVSGDTNIKALRDKNIGIWNSWLMPGTAVHEDLDYDKLNAAICKKLKVASFTIELQCADTMADLHLTAFTSAVQVVEFRREGNPPTAVIAIEQPIWAACVSNEGYGVSLENAQVAIAKALGVATTRLVSGDIGKGGYGAQWRNLEDTQMIPACDRADYIAQGYTIVGNLNSSVGADYRDWDLKGKIKQAIFTKLDEVNVVDFVEGCDDVDEFNDNTYKYRTERACNVMTVYYSGYRALQELYKALYDIPTLVAHRKIDQLQNAIDLLKSDPDSRRIIVSAWNPALTWKAALPPCFEAGTLVATPDGYKAIEEIEEGEMVLSGTGVPRRVNKKWVTPYTGEMISLKVGYVGPRINCTPNHPFLVKDKGYVEAKDILPNDFIGVPKTRSLKDHTFNVTTNRGQGRTRTESVSLTVEDYYTLGYFMGNGWASHTGNRVSFAIPHAKVEDILPKLRKTIRISRKPGDALNVSTYETRSDKWNSLFREFGHKAHNKKIPQWVMESTPEAKESFLEGFFDADGHFPYLGAVSVSTTSPSVAYGIQRLLADFGLTPSVRFKKKNPTHVIEGRTVNQRDLWYVDAKIPINRPQVAHDDEYIWVPVKNIERYNTETTVYNFDVEEEHTYMVQNLATHNCHLYFQFISLELTVMQRVAIYNDRTDLAQRDHARNNEQSFVTWEHLHVDSWLAAVADSSQAELENLHKELDERQVARRGLYCFLLLRSNDLGLGMPFNITQYAALTHMVAQLVGMESIELVWSAVDAHVYNDHVAGLTEQLQRDSVDAIPRLVLDKKVTNIDDFNIGSIELIDYKSQPPLTNKMLPSV